jgi:hypothetical protein
MTFGPYNCSPYPQTVEQAYDALRFHCERLEELLEANAEGHNDKALKRSDKAVTVMKVGFKILKKAIKRRPHLTVVKLRPASSLSRPDRGTP